MNAINHLWQWLLRRAKGIGLVGAGLIMGGVGSALVMAAIPDASGVIHGCYNTSKGDLRIIDSVTSACTNKETAITWNQTGPQGPQGPAGTSSNSGQPLSCPGCTFNDFQDLGDRFKGKDLSSAYLPSAHFGAFTDLSGTNFTDAQLAAARFNQVLLTGANFHHANLVETIIESSTLDNTDFSNTYYSANGGLSLMNNQGSNTNFSNANLPNARFNSSVLSNASFAAATLTSADFGQTDLSGSDFTNTNLSGAVNLESATLIGVIWSNTTCPDGTNSNANGGSCAGHLTP